VCVGGVSFSSLRAWCVCVGVRVCVGMRAELRICAHFKYCTPPKVWFPFHARAHRLERCLLELESEVRLACKLRARACCVLMLKKMTTTHAHTLGVVLRFYLGGRPLGTKVQFQPGVEPLDMARRLSPAQEYED
jgi:hypothetical protein